MPVLVWSQVAAGMMRQLQVRQHGIHYVVAVAAGMSAAAAGVLVPLQVLAGTGTAKWQMVAVVWDSQ